MHIYKIKKIPLMMCLINPFQIPPDCQKFARIPIPQNKNP